MADFYFRGGEMSFSFFGITYLCLIFWWIIYLFWCIGFWKLGCTTVPLVCMGHGLVFVLSL